MHDDVIFALAGIGIISILCQWIAWRVKLPAILFLLLAGIIAGPGLSNWRLFFSVKTAIITH